MSRIHLAALASALAIFASPALAASSASASINNIRFQVIDLTPTDAQVSGFSLLNLPGSLSFNISDMAQGASESYNFNRSGLGTFTKSAAGDLGSAAASLSAGTNALSVQGQAFGPGTSFSASINGSGAYYYNGSLRLSANSVLVITADSVLSASATNPSACLSGYYFGCSNSEQATASSWLNLSYSLPSPAGSVSGSSSNNMSLTAQARGESSYRYVYSYDYSKPDWYNHPLYTTVVNPRLEQTLSDSRQFYAVFANTTSSEQTASFSIGVQVNGYASTAPVPEAGSIAMSLAGLAFVSGVALRRRNRAV
jgi:hypothetical protein